MKIEQQLKDNAIAIMSLIIAIVALTYSGWREEQTEKNRNIRVAAFEILKNLGELQFLVNTIFYEQGHVSENRISAWGRISMIGDLAPLVPSPVPQTAQELLKVWTANQEKIEQDETSVDKITEAIDKTRTTVVKELYSLR